MSLLAPFNWLYSLFFAALPGSPDLAKRQRIALDTITRTEAVTAAHINDGATTDSKFIEDQLPALDPLERPNPNPPPSTITVVNSDSFTAARAIMEEDPSARGRTVVLNLASDQERAGGWFHTLSRTQEEALCYSSTLYETLKDSYYPWPNLGPGSVAGIFSPGIVIFKNDLDHGCVDLPVAERRVASVITVAAPRRPELTKDRTQLKNPSDMEDFRQKIRLVYRMAAHNKQQYLVLAAMGCGAYQCPPRLVAEEMKSMLLEEEFKGWFIRIVFAVYSVKSDEPTNCDIFKEILDGVQI